VFSVVCFDNTDRICMRCSMKKNTLVTLSLSLLFFISAGIPFDGLCSSDATKDDLTTINRSFLPTPDEMQKWSVLKDAGGPTFAGSPSWKSYVAFLEKGFSKRGLVDIKKDSTNYNRWFTSDDRATGDWSLFVDGKEVPVASYWANSGSTSPSGTRAPLIYYDTKNPPTSIEGKIVVFDTPPLPFPPTFCNPGYEYASDLETHRTDCHSLDSWYQATYYTRFGKFSEILTSGKASGALVISDMGPGRAKGVYTLPLTPAEFGVPGLNLDRIAGKSVRQAAMEGRTATLKLLAKREKAEAHFLSGFLPGRNYGKDEDEMVLLISHTDGPNISQENGGLGTLAIIEYFSHIPQNRRARTLLVILDPQHYVPARHAVDWYELHPVAARKIVASIGVEHLGQLEYREKGDDFLPTGLPEETQLFVQDNDMLIKMGINAVKDTHLPRTLVQCPPRKGQGMWMGMGTIATKRHIPGYGITASANGYWSTEARIERFDKDLAWKQIAVLTRLTGELMKADLKEIAVP
jgi:hypothetical protein